MKRSLKDLLVEQPERGVQYKTLNDAAMAQSGRAKGFEQGMQPGDVKIWYYRSEVGRDVSFGIDFYVNKHFQEKAMDALTQHPRCCH